MQAVIAGTDIVFDIPVQAGKPFRHRVGLEQRLRLVEPEGLCQGKLVQPPRRRFAPVQVNRLRTLDGNIVAEPLQIECGAAADDEWLFQKDLQRYDSLLPGQASSRPLIGPASRLLEPAGRNILAAKAAGITLAFHPGGVDQQPLGQGFVQPV